MYKKFTAYLGLMVIIAAPLQASSWFSTATNSVKEALTPFTSFRGGGVVGSAAGHLAYGVQGSLMTLMVKDSENQYKKINCSLTSQWAGLQAELALRGGVALVFGNGMTYEALSKPSKLALSATASYIPYKQKLPMQLAAGLLKPRTTVKLDYVPEHDVEHGGFVLGQQASSRLWYAFPTLVNWVLGWFARWFYAWFGYEITWLPFMAVGARAEGGHAAYEEETSYVMGAAAQAQAQTLGCYYERAETTYGFDSMSFHKKAWTRPGFGGNFTLIRLEQDGKVLDGYIIVVTAAYGAGIGASGSLSGTLKPLGYKEAQPTQKAMTQESQ